MRLDYSYAVFHRTKSYDWIFDIKDEHCFLIHIVEDNVRRKLDFIVKSGPLMGYIDLQEDRG